MRIRTLFLSSGLVVVFSLFSAFPARSATPFGPPFQVNLTPTGYGNYPGENPTVAMDNAGDFIVGWSSGDVVSDCNQTGEDVFMRRYDSSATPLTGEIRVNYLWIDPQVFPDVKYNPASGFIFAWRGGESWVCMDPCWCCFCAQTGPLPYSRIFDASGNPVTTDINAQPSEAITVSGPRLAIDTSGNYVMTWVGYTFNEDNIYAERYDSAGNPLGDVFVVNTTIKATERENNVAMLPTGEYVVVWGGYDAGEANDAVFGLSSKLIRRRQRTRIVRRSPRSATALLWLHGTITLKAAFTMSISGFTTQTARLEPGKSV
jgi:hypothetical protein